MNLRFKPIEAKDLNNLCRFYGKRENKTCDSMPLDSFLWREYYKVRFALSDEKAIQWLLQDGDTMCSAMPVCSEEELPYYFDEIVKYFNQELKLPLRINLADEAAVEMLRLKENEDFEVTEQVDLRDYLYHGDDLRILSGKKLRKKKNHINAFVREYEGRYHYRRLDCSDRNAVWEFLDQWRELKGDEVEAHLDYEVRGIHDLLKNCCDIPVRMAGVFIDEKLQAFTIGSYNALEDMAIIHIEKARPDIRGLYPFINQQFLLHEFPTVRLVNREDDLGEPGLRKAKESYDPCDYARKYLVQQKKY